MKTHRRTDIDGLLVVIEGIDGSGKSTLIGNLTDILMDTEVPSIGHGFTSTCEPTHEPPGLLDGGFEAHQLQWFLGDRERHQKTQVIPALKKGHIVLQDRSWHSTIAYQGEHFSEEEIIAEMEKRPPLLPDILLILDIAPEVAHERVLRRSRMRDESDDPMAPVELHQYADPVEIERMQRIRDRYLKMTVSLIEYASSLIVLLDALQDEKTLADKAMGYIRAVLDGTTHRMKLSLTQRKKPIGTHM